MSEEIMVENGAADATRETKHNPARALASKIARLPKGIREQLNRRLDDGEPASAILPWLNGLPVVKKVLAAYFGGAPMNEGNLSLWRHNGYQRWVEKQELAAEVKALAEETEDFSRAAGEKLARGAAMMASVRVLKMLRTMSPEQCTPGDMAKLCFAVTALAQVEQSNERLKNEKTRVFQGNERLVLSWDKFLRGCVDAVQRALNDELAKDIQAADIDNGEKIELLGHRLFGKKWQGREVPVPENPPAMAKGQQPEKAEATEDPSPAPAPEQPIENGLAQNSTPPPHPMSPLPPISPISADPVAAARQSADRPAGCGKLAGDSVQHIQPVAGSAGVPRNLSGHSPDATSVGGEGLWKRLRRIISPQPAPDKGKSDGNLTRENRGNRGAADKPSRPETSKLKAPPSSPPKPPLNDHEKALLEGKSRLDALWAQFTPAPKPPRPAQPAKPPGEYVTYHTSYLRCPPPNDNWRVKTS